MILKEVPGVPGLEISPDGNVVYYKGKRKNAFHILNASGNVPFLDLIMRENGANEINNSRLVQDIYEIFKVDKLRVFAFRLYLTYFATVNKLDLYRMELRDSKGNKFDSNLKIVENE